MAAKRPGRGEPSLILLHLFWSNVAVGGAGSDLHGKDHVTAVLEWVRALLPRTLLVVTNALHHSGLALGPSAWTGWVAQRDESQLASSSADLVVPQ